MLGSQCWVLGSGFRDRVLGTGFSVLGTRFWVQGQNEAGMGLGNEAGELA